MMYLTVLFGIFLLFGATCVFIAAVGHFFTLSKGLFNRVNSTVFFIYVCTLSTIAGVAFGYFLLPEYVSMLKNEIERCNFGFLKT